MTGNRIVAIKKYLFFVTQLFRRERFEENTVCLDSCNETIYLNRLYFSQLLFLIKITSVTQATYRTCHVIIKSVSFYTTSTFPKHTVIKVPEGSVR